MEPKRLPGGRGESKRLPGHAPGDPARPRGSPLISQDVPGTLPGTIFGDFRDVFYDCWYSLVCFYDFLIFCNFLLLLVVAGCCWLLLVVAACCWLLLVAVGCFGTFHLLFDLFYNFR